MRKILGISLRSQKWQSRYTVICLSNDAQNNSNTLLGVYIINSLVKSKNYAQYFDVSKKFCTFVYGEYYILLARDIGAVFACWLYGTEKI